MPADTDPTSSNAAAEAADASSDHDADREPTPDEEQVAEDQASKVDPKVSDYEKEMARKGADAKGEGRITG